MNRSLSLLALLGLLVGCQEYTIQDFGRYTGRGEAPPLQTPTKTDVVRQTLSRKVDVLWVIDNSGSMLEEQDELSLNLPAFSDQLFSSGLDWHIGITTVEAGIGGTDDTNVAADAGALVPMAGYRYLTKDVPRAAELFSLGVRVGANGQSEETGLLAAFRAIAQPTARVQQANAGFLREDASLHIIVISDEDDRAGHLLSVNEVASFLQNLKTDEFATVTFNAIVGDDPGGCTRSGGGLLPDSSAEAGTRYLEVTQLVGGIDWSICTQDWSEVLAAIGLQAAQLKEEYFLTEVPVPGSVSIRVKDGDDGWLGVEVQDLSEVDAACEARDSDAPCFGFRYDPTRNSATLLGWVPPQGSIVRITYELLSGQQAEEVVEE
ncbi:MAG: hypothetical protein H6733_06955 [Alphaproteobacteria bacterium]|nr:hypothetical protein [Alphaproteobacteria bacterium]